MTTKTHNHVASARKTYLADLKECSSTRNLTKGRTVHEAVIQSGYDSDAWIANTLINMYCKCRSLREALKVFEGMQNRTVVSWNALISGYVENGEPKLALDLFARMKQEICPHDERTLVAALNACTALTTINGDEYSRDRGKMFHLLAIITGCYSSVFVQCALVVMYSKSANMIHAQWVFDRIQEPDVVVWNALILGYAGNGNCNMALNLFSRMEPRGFTPNSRSFVAALKACTVEKEKIESGRALHLIASCCGFDSDIYVASVLVDMYASCGRMEQARYVFDNMEHQDVVSWNSLMQGYAENGEGEKALTLFCKMSREDCPPIARTFVAVLKACTNIAVEGGDNLATRKIAKALHMLASISGCDTGTYIEGSLVDLYAKCGSMNDACKVFEKIKNPDTISWNSLILGFADNGKPELALDYFDKMEMIGCNSNDRTFVGALKACSDLAENETDVTKPQSRERSKAIHMLSTSSGCDANLFVQNTLMDMYAKCRLMDESRKIFDSIVNPNIISWNALMLGYADNGEGNLVMKLFSRMKREGCKPDTITFAIVLKACTILGSLDSGRTVHSEMCNSELGNDPVLATCLIDFYAKSGSLQEAEQAFNVLKKKDLVAWNALMAGYSRIGDTKGVFDLFDGLQASRLRPDGATFSCILSVCSHSSLVDEGEAYFKLMSTAYAITPDAEHYNCMIDILSRSNKLEKAMFMLRNMPCCPSVVTWTTVLAACQKWKNLKLGTMAFESFMYLDRRTSGAYVLMANLYGTQTDMKTPTKNDVSSSCT